MDGEPPQEEDFSQIPLVERSQHKNWKARLSAYTDVASKAAKTASDTDPFFRSYVNDGALLKRWCLDANVVAQEKGIEAVLAIVQNSGETGSRTRGDVVPALVEKSLGAMRQGTKKKGGELCAMYVEVENTGEGVVTDVLAGLDSKQPKVVAGCAACLKDLVESFGVSALGNVKPLLKSLSKIFAHNDKNVRAEGTSLVLALYTYLGAAIMPALADLKPLQMTELQKSFDAMQAEGRGGGSGRPTRWTRQGQREREAAAASAGDGGDGEEAGAGGADEGTGAIDPRDLLDPVDVLSLFPADLDERLASTKWKDRSEALVECNAVVSNPQNSRISDSNIDMYGSLVSTLGTKCKSDANVVVVQEAAKLIEGLARGMGKPFGRFRGSVMIGCLERLKERKASVVDALGKALDAIFSTITFSDMVEDVLTYCKSKNPQVKEGTLKFLHRSLQVTLDAPTKDQVKPIAETLVSLLSDSSETIRAIAAECLGTMMKIVGERAFNPYIEGVEELKMQRVKDAFAKAEIKYRAGGAKPKPATGGVRPGGPTVKKPAAAGPSKPTAGPPNSPPVRPSAAPPSSPPIRASAFSSSSPPIKASGTFGGDDPLLDEFSAPPTKAPPARFARPPPKPAAAASDELVDELAPPARPPPARFAKPAAASKTPTSSAPSSPPKPSAPPPSARKPPTAGPSKPPAPPKPSAAAGKSGATKTLAISPSEPVKFKFTPEDAAARAADEIPGDFHTKLADGSWKVRLEGADELVTWVGEEGGAGKVEAEVIMRFLSKTPGWGEKNFQVSGKLYQVMQLVAEQSPTFGKPAAALCIPGLTDKLGDMKLKKPAGDALTAFAEKTSLAFVLAQAYEPLGKQKAPKAQADALVWIKQQLVDFGIAGIPLRDLISFVKTALGSPNAQVRQSATQVLVTVKVFVGGDISGFIEDLNPQLLSTINSEFDKAASQTPPEPTRTQADLQDVAAGAGKSGKAAGGGDPLDDLIPRVDLDKLVSQTSVLTDARSDAWKVRKEAFEALAALLEVKSNSRLKPNMGEIGGVLKKAVADTNLAVKMLALGIISKIATGMGQPFDKHLRLLTAPVASVCADQKATTRSAALATLTAMADASGGIDGMFAGLGASLESSNPALRSSVLGWMADRLQTETPSPAADLTSLAAPIISCLEDRNGDVRKGAGAILPFVVASAGYDFVMDQTTKLKPASKATIVPLIQNARGAAPAASSSSVPAPTKAAPGAAPSKLAKTPAKAAARPAVDSPRAGAPPAARSMVPPARSLAMKALSSAPPSRPPLSLSDDRPTVMPKPRAGFGIRPGLATSHAPPSSSAAAVSPPSIKIPPFTTADPSARATRLKRDSTRWTLDASQAAEYLSAQMEPLVAPEVFSLLFSKDHKAEEDFMAGLSLLADFFDEGSPVAFGLSEDEAREVQLANVDLALKYASMRLLGNNTQLAIRCLEVVSRVQEMMVRENERFSDAEAKLFVPALIIKLGDAKFVARLVPTFESLDKIIAGSQVVQLLVQYGLEDKSAGKTCKNESLGLIEKAYRKRGSILRTKDDRGFYEAVARCVADNGTRRAALSVMALLQLQGGSASLNAVVEAMPQGQKDMLANRRATMATTKTGPSAPVVAKVAADTVGASADSPSRLRRPLSAASPRLKQPSSFADSPMQKAIPSPARVTKSAAASPVVQRTIAPPSGLPRPGLAGESSKLQRPTDLFAAAKPAMQPIGGRTPAVRPLNNNNNGATPTSSTDDRISGLLNDLQQNDIDRVVDTLKVLQQMLEDRPEVFLPTAPTLVDLLMDRLERAFTPPENLNDARTFRLVKHLIQTVSGVTSQQDLMRRLSYDDVYGLLAGLSLELVQADRMGGTVSELAKFINMIVIQTLSTPDRAMVYKAMFRLLLSLCRGINASTPADSEIVANAELILKGLWKRCKLLEDDFKLGRNRPGTLLVTLEEFLEGIGPAEWRKRQAEGVPLGEMPLRTVKTIIQRIIIYTREEGLEIYDILLAEFGDSAAETIIYSYVFRLAGREPIAGQASGSSRPPSSNGTRPRSALSGANSEANGSPSLAAPESEAEKLVRNLRTGGRSGEHFDELHAFMKAHPDKEPEVQAAIDKLSKPLQTFVRRALETRRTSDNPSPARGDHVLSPIRSPSHPPSQLHQQQYAPSTTAPPSSFATRPIPRKGPRPSSLAAVDKSAPVDDQLAAVKNIFQRGSLGSSGSGSGSKGNSPGERGVLGEGEGRVNRSKEDDLSVD